MVRRGRVVAGDGEWRHAAAPHHQAAEGQGHRARPQGLVQVDTRDHGASASPHADVHFSVCSNTSTIIIVLL